MAKKSKSKSKFKSALAKVRAAANTKIAAIAAVAIIAGVGTSAGYRSGAESARKPAYIQGCATGINVVAGAIGMPVSQEKVEEFCARSADESVQGVSDIGAKGFWYTIRLLTKPTE